MLKKTAYKKEPIMKTQYVIRIGTKSKTGMKWVQHYRMNLKEARAVARTARKGAKIEFFRATFNFIQAYEKA